jgi:hypothetical protein
VKHFRRYYAGEDKANETEMARPFDYKSLLKDEEFKSINSEIISNRKWNINSLERLLGEVQDLITQIDSELKGR